MASSPYARWPNGPSPDPAYFPVGVWVQDPANAARYQQIGVNVYVGLWEGPTEEQLAALAEVGMRVVCVQNEVGLGQRDDPLIMAWMHGDEPDNAQALPDGKGWGAAVPPDEIIANYQRLKAQDPTRPVWLNLGQGVANEDFKGRAAPYEDYPRYLEGADIVSFDVYPVAGIRKADGANYLWYVAKGVDRLRQWSSPPKPVWNVIETTRISSQYRATPGQVEAEVWMSLIHGSQGIVYFAHEWEPRFVEARLLEDEEMRQAVGAINRQIRELAPVLNSPTVAGGAEVVSSAVDTPIDIMVKQYQGDTYLFAVPMRMGAAQGRFRVAGAVGTQTAEVLGEGRTIHVVDGDFADDFAEYQVHGYRLPGIGR